MPLRDALLERRDDLLVGDLLALQVPLHQLVRVLRHLVHQLLSVLLGLGSQVVGDLGLGRVAPLLSRVLERLHVDQVDHPAHLVLGADRDLGGHHMGAECLLEGVERAEEVGALAVEHVDEHQAGQAIGVGAVPEALGVDLDPITALTTTTAASTTRRPASVSATKLGSPGVSIRLIFRSPYSNEATLAPIDIPRSCSSGSKSETVVPSSTRPSRLITPASNSSASQRLVLPLPR